MLRLSKQSVAGSVFGKSLGWRLLSCWRLADREYAWQGTLASWVRRAQRGEGEAQLGWRRRQTMGLSGVATVDDEAVNRKSQ